MLNCTEVHKGMASDISSHFSVTASRNPPSKPLPSIPSAASECRDAFARKSEISALSHSQHGPAVFNWPVSESAAEREASRRRGSPVSSVQVSLGTAATPSTDVIRRPGPRGVQWDASNNRKYARLYSLSDAHIDDIPLIMEDDKLKFK